MTSLSALVSPVTIDLGPVVRPADVGGSVAFGELIRHGALTTVYGESAVPTGTTQTPALRAAALAPSMPRGTVIAGASAVWVHAGGQAPETLTLICPPGTARPRRLSTIHARYVKLLAGETMLSGDVRVTAPLRTVLDVASAPYIPPRLGGGEPSQASVADAVRQVLQVCTLNGLSPGGAAAALALKYRWAGRDVAERVLADAARQADLGR